MKQTVLATLIALAATLAFGPVARAATDAEHAAAHEKWQSMTPEEKAAAKAKMKEKWDAMTPEQQAEAKKRMAEKRAARHADDAASAATH